MDYFRAMRADVDALPVVGRSAWSLGVRVPADIQPSSDGLVHPATGGMSVAPGTVWNVPNHRRPRGLAGGSTGPSGDRIYSIEEAPIHLNDLSIRPDPARPDRHAFVEPARDVSLEIYESSLAATRPSWKQVWPE